MNPWSERGRPAIFTVMEGKGPLEAKTPPFDTRPRTTPEAMWEDHWRYFDMTPEERDLEIQSVCQTAMRQWWAKSKEEREIIEWAESLAPGWEILRRWARECRERATDQR